MHPWAIGPSIRLKGHAHPYLLPNRPCEKGETHEKNCTFNVAGHEVSLHSVTFGAFIVAGALVLMLVPCTRSTGVILTEPVEKA